LVIGFIDHLQIVTTNKCNTVTEFRTTKHSTLTFTSLHGFITQKLRIKASLNHTLPIALYYSTHKVFRSHVKSSQADFLYSSVLLELTAYCCTHPT
jgi:hypothetical protein